MLYNALWHDCNLAESFVVLTMLQCLTLVAATELRSKHTALQTNATFHAKSIHCPYQWSTSTHEHTC